MRIIPAIDIMNGRCVRLEQGDYGRLTVYGDDPVDTAVRLESEGIRYLHVVDLDGARQKHVVNMKVLEALLKATRLVIDFGGGVRTEEEVERVLGLGTSQVVTGSVAACEPETVARWIDRHGPEKFLVAADVLGGKVKVGGWCEEAGVGPDELIKSYRGLGVTRFMVTDISKDGLLAGPNLSLYRDLVPRFPGSGIVASGGVSSIADVDAVRDTGVEGLIIGKALYEGRVTVPELLAREGCS